MTITKKAGIAVTDITPPTPDPMTWSDEPIGTSHDTITMSATNATDVNGVEYYFECIENSTFDSGWQDDRVYAATSMLSNTVYSFRAKARDKSSNSVIGQHLAHLV